MSFISMLARIIEISLGVGALVALALLVRSVIAFSQAGPRMTEEVMAHFRRYLVLCLVRLGLAAWVVASWLAAIGVSAYALGGLVLGFEFSGPVAGAFGLVAVAAGAGRQFANALLYSPGLIVASSHYAIPRFYPLWERLSPARLRALDALLLAVLALCLGTGLASFALAHAWGEAAALLGWTVLLAAIPLAAALPSEPRPVKATRRAGKPNFLLIGADTLRADRLGSAGYPRSLTPVLDGLARNGTSFANCYVPCARTAPSMVSLLTGTWPHTHGVRDNFTPPEQTRLPVASLPQLLGRAGYRSAAVGDWAASDLGKYSFGFDELDVPPDQWNLRYLMRQGPKDIRLFLSLFAMNPLGKAILPEIYYLAGVPSTDRIGRDTRRMIARHAACDEPFFLMSFTASTHPPFASRYPYYGMYADPAYRGPSKFAMARLTDPFEIIERQGEPRREFDLDQILNLYDGCVRSFDHEVGRILGFLEECDLAQNTVVVVFSDHGMEFFEHETWGQGNSAIGDFSARVPLILSGPGIPEGRLTQDVVRTVDLAPTLLELAGVSAGPMEGVPLPEVSAAARSEPPRPAFYETGIWLTNLPGTPFGHLRYPKAPELLEVPDKRLGTIAIKDEYRDAIVAAKDRMVRVGHWKLTYQPLVDGALWKLFNLEHDPECRCDVLAQHPEVAEPLRRMLDEWMRAAPPVSRPLAERSAASAAPSVPNAIPEVSP